MSLDVPQSTPPTRRGGRPGHSQGCVVWSGRLEAPDNGCPGWRDLTLASECVIFKRGFAGAGPWRATWSCQRLMREWLRSDAAWRPACSRSRSQRPRRRKLRLLISLRRQIPAGSAPMATAHSLVLSGPVASAQDDPAHPFVPNGVGQATYRIADLTNPNLKPWVKEHMRQDIAEVLAGELAYTPRSSCMMAGVPAFMAYGGGEPVYFVQTPKQVWIIYSGDQQVRRVYMDVPHTPNPTPSWYGESVGHYERHAGGRHHRTTTTTVLDPYRTPIARLHILQRWRSSTAPTLEVSSPSRYHLNQLGADRAAIGP